MENNLTETHGKHKETGNRCTEMKNKQKNDWSEETQDDHSKMRNKYNEVKNKDREMQKNHKEKRNDPEETPMTMNKCKIRTKKFKKEILRN